MENVNFVQKLNSMIDFTLLDPRATIADLEKMCQIAYKNGYYSVCVNPCNVKYVKAYISQNLLNALKVVSVIGFPLGANSVASKEFETRQVLNDGADEIDVVINIGEAKNGNFDYIKKELKQIKKITKKHILKAIIETCYFDNNEIVKLCNCAINAKVDYIKTSTGFGTGGVNAEMIKLIKNTVGNKCKIKASGGIRSRQDALEYIGLGVDRIGTSHVI